MSVNYVCLVSAKARKRVLDPLELGLWMVVITMQVLEIEPGSSRTMANALIWSLCVPFPFLAPHFLCTMK